MPKFVATAIITTLHDLFTTAWIGGMLTLGLATLPALKKTLGSGPQLQQVVYAVYKRLQVVAKISMLGLLITGVMLARQSEHWQGPLSLGNFYSALLAVKHILVLAMLGVAAGRSLTMERVQRTGQPTQAQSRALTVLLAVNIVLGVAVLALSGFSAVLGQVCAVPRLG